jgi:hypothetical protein
MRLGMLVAAAALALAGCVEVSGGAVEARWDLRDAKGGVRIDCAKAAIRAMRFVLERPAAASPDPCAAGDGTRCQFECARGVGTTDFFIPEGEYSISLRAVATDGRLLGVSDGVVTPAPVIRQVRVGQLVDLAVSLVIVALPGD